jgi:hypothetical protein
MGPIERGALSHWTSSFEDGNRSSSQSVISLLEHFMMEKVQKTGSFNCNLPLVEPFKID